MRKPKIGIIVPTTLRNRILSPDDLEKLKSFADVEINLEDRQFTEEEAGEFLSDKDGAMAESKIITLKGEAPCQFKVSFLLFRDFHINTYLQ